MVLYYYNDTEIDYDYLDKQMLPTDWNHLYHTEFVEALRHIRMASRVYLCVCYLAIVAVITSTVSDRKLMFVCYFPFET